MSLLRLITFRQQPEQPTGIVTSDLILHLDAGNSASYPGTGTTWTDLSGQGNDGTLVNGVGYSSNDGGYLTFDGVDDYVNNGAITTGGKITVSAWIKINTGGIYNQIVDSSSNSWHLAISNINRPYMYNGSAFHTSGQILSTSTWYMITAVQGSTLDVYVNDVLSASVASNVNVTTNNVNIGRWQFSTTSRYFNGNIAQVYLYNRALTLAEIQQNFNALRGRYGI